MNRDRHINLSNLRVVDASQVISRLGVMEPKYWPEIERAIAIEFGFSAVFGSN